MVQPRSLPLLFRDQAPASLPPSQLPWLQFLVISVSTELVLFFFFVVDFVIHWNEELVLLNKKIKCIYLFLVARRLSLVAVNGGYYPATVLWLLLMVASLVVECGLEGVWALAVVHGLSCPLGMWNCPGPGIEPVPPALAGWLLTTGPPLKSLELVLSTSCSFIPCSALPRRCWTFPLLRPAKPVPPLLQPPPNFSALLIFSEP